MEYNGSIIVEMNVMNWRKWWEWAGSDFSCSCRVFSLFIKPNWQSNTVSTSFQWEDALPSYLLCFLICFSSLLRSRLKTRWVSTTWRWRHSNWLCCSLGTRDPERESALRTSNWPQSCLMQSCAVHSGSGNNLNVVFESNSHIINI